MSNKATTGQEPQLSSDEASILTGYEPLLGGIHRAGVDPDRLQALLGDGDTAITLDFIDRLGQGDIYARELARVIRQRERIQVGDWRGSYTPGQRIRAMRVLASIGSYECVIPLIEMLNDNMSEVRMAAGEALTAVCRRLDPGDKRTRIVYEALVEAMAILQLQGRKVVADILSGALPDRVLGPLLGKGMTAEDWQTRRETAWVLGKLGDKRATVRLIDALKDESPAVRTSAAWALGQIDAPIAVNPLIEALQTDPDEVVRAALVEALGVHLGRLSALDGAFQPVLEQIINALSDTDSVRLTAIDVLTGMESPEVRRVIRKILNRE